MKFMRQQPATADAEPRFRCLVCGEIVKPTAVTETDDAIIYTLVCRKCGARDKVTVPKPSAG
jgi:transcription elongation factor Elf1